MALKMSCGLDPEFSTAKYPLTLSLTSSYGTTLFSSYIIWLLKIADTKSFASYPTWNIDTLQQCLRKNESICYPNMWGHPNSITSSVHPGSYYFSMYAVNSAYTAPLW